MSKPTLGEHRNSWQITSNVCSSQELLNPPIIYPSYKIMDFHLPGLPKGYGTHPLSQESFGRVVGCSPSEAHHSTAPARPWGRRSAALSPPGCSLERLLSFGRFPCFFLHLGTCSLQPPALPSSHRANVCIL